MGKRGPESFMKRQKELKRKQKAQEKMARRQGKRKQQQVAEGLGAAILGVDQSSTTDSGEPQPPGEGEASDDYGKNSEGVGDKGPPN